MTDYPMLDEKLATLRHAIEGGVKADSMQALKLMELVDAIGEQFKRELADAAAVAPAVDARDERAAFEQFLRDKKFPVLPVWQRGKPHQNYALEVMWDSWQARAALSARASDAAAGAPTFDAKHVSLKQKGDKIILTLELDGLEGAPRYRVTPINPAVVRSHPAIEPKAEAGVQLKERHEEIMALAIDTLNRREHYNIATALHGVMSELAASGATQPEARPSHCVNTCNFYNFRRACECPEPQSEAGAATVCATCNGTQRVDGMPVCSWKSCPDCYRASEPKALTLTDEQARSLKYVIARLEIASVEAECEHARNLRALLKDQPC
jgi:hypothetical protein